jgi:hypothetical protein
MITRSMKASGNYRIRFPNGLSPKKKRVQPNKQATRERANHERANRERANHEKVEIIYRRCLIHVILGRYIPYFIAVLLYTYIFILYANLFHSIWLKEQRMIGYEPRLMIGY